MAPLWSKFVQASWKVLANQLDALVGPEVKLILGEVGFETVEDVENRKETGVEEGDVFVNPQGPVRIFGPCRCTVSNGHFDSRVKSVW